jgi:hypothetical protein
MYAKKQLPQRIYFLLKGASRCGETVEASRPPQEMDGRHGPVVCMPLDAVAETRGVAVGDVVAPDHVRSRPVEPGEARHLHNHPAGAGHAVHHTVSSRHPALRQRLDPRRQLSETAEESLVRIMPLERELIARDLGVVHHGLLQLVAEDRLADGGLDRRARRPRIGTPALGGRGIACRWHAGVSSHRPPQDPIDA